MQLIEVKKQAGLSRFAVTVVLGLLALFFFVWPLYGQVSQKNDTISQNQASLADLQSKYSQFQQSVKNVKDNQNGFDRLNVAIPTGSQLTHFYALLEDLVKGSNLTFSGLDVVDQSSIKPTDVSATATPPPPGPGGLSVLLLNLDVKGPIESLNQFLTAVKQSLRFIDIQGVDITTNVGSVPSYRIVAKSYYYKGQ